MLIKVPKGWEIPEREAAPESWWHNRRELLRAAGFLGIGALAAPARIHAATESKSRYPAKQNPEYTLDRPVTEEWAATGYNNYYEFHPTSKEAPRTRTGKFRTSPWKIDVKGLVAKSFSIDLEELLGKVTLEERLYRFRCVEAWSMAVPWTGFPLAEFIKMCDPKPSAKFLRFETVNRPDEMPGMREANWYPWPYFEALRMDEAMNPLTLMVTGIYGKPLPVQNGAPIRIIAPWKYGYKSPKSIVKVEFTDKQPETFWHKLQPLEYGLYSNVNPHKPHPRWSQAFEKAIPTMERRPTLMYNGYEQFVAGLYKGDPDR